MPLSWNEIKSRALQFTQEWKDEVSEDAEAKSFWDDFFNVFGISRRRLASFTHKVKLETAARQRSIAVPLERGQGAASLADLYDLQNNATRMVRAYQALDKAVDLCYRPQPFINETKRIEFLFELYDKYTSGGVSRDRKI